MKTLRLLFMLLFAATLTPAKGYSNPKASSMMTLENHSEKLYIEPSNLYFSDDGIFLKICSNEWRPIGHICYDTQGYYLIVSVLLNNLEIYETTTETANYISEYDFDMDNKLALYSSQGDEQEFYALGEEIREFGSRVSQVPKKWKCPYCNHWWLMGEECQNEDCPTNQWKKKDKAES